MARVTVEDCVIKVPNRFELLLMAATRARQLSGGEPPLLEEDNDKHPVIALREIAESAITTDDLREMMVRSHQRHAEVDEPEEEDVTHLLTQQFAAGENGAPAGAASITSPNEAVEFTDVDDDA